MSDKTTEQLKEESEAIDVLRSYQRAGETFKQTVRRLSSYSRGALAIATLDEKEDKWIIRDLPSVSSEAKAVIQNTIYDNGVKSVQVYRRVELEVSIAVKVGD